MNQMRWGVIGCGMRAMDIIRQTRRADDRVTVSAVCDPSEAGVERARSVNPDAAVERDPRRLAGRADVDWVLIGSPNAMHRAHAEAAFAAGKPTFIEKPLATTLDDGLAIRNAWRAAGVTCIVGYTLRYSPHFGRIKDLLDAGVAGEIISMEFNETLDFNHGGFIHQDWRRHSAEAGSHLLEKCCHDLDLANWYVGALPVRVASFGGLGFFTPDHAHHADRIGPNPDNGRPAYRGWGRPGDPFTADKDIVDHQVAILEYADGVRATFHTNCNAGIPERRTCILGAEGAIRADGVACWIEHQRIGWNEPRDRIDTRAEEGGHGGADKVMGESVVRTMFEGEPPLATPDDGVVSAAVAWAIDEAMERGEVVDLRPTWQRIGVDPAAPAAALR